MIAIYIFLDSITEIVEAGTVETLVVVISYHILTAFSSFSILFAHCHSFNSTLLEKIAFLVWVEFVLKLYEEWWTVDKVEEYLFAFDFACFWARWEKRGYLTRIIVIHLDTHFKVYHKYWWKSFYTSIFDQTLPSISIQALKTIITTFLQILYFHYITFSIDKRKIRINFNNIFFLDLDSLFNTSKR